MQNWEHLQVVISDAALYNIHYTVKPVQSGNCVISHLFKPANLKTLLLLLQNTLPNAVTYVVEKLRPIGSLYCNAYLANMLVPL